MYKSRDHDTKAISIKASFKKRNLRVKIQSKTFAILYAFILFLLLLFEKYNAVCLYVYLYTVSHYSSYKKCVEQQCRNRLFDIEAFDKIKLMLQCIRFM